MVRRGVGCDIGPHSIVAVDEAGDGGLGVGAASERRLRGGDWRFGQGARRRKDEERQEKYVGPADHRFLSLLYLSALALSYAPVTGD